MRVTLIYPAIGHRKNDSHIRSWEVQPLAPAALKKSTPSHIDVRFYDDRIEPIPFDEPTDLVGISVMTHTAMRSYQIASEYRRRGVPVVLGGFHVSAAPEEASRYAEAIVIGEAERAWPALLADFEAGRMQRVYQMPLEDLSGIGCDRSIFAGKRYFPVTLIENSRGCRNACDFCSVRQHFGGTHHVRPVADVVAEMREAGGKAFIFVDDNALSDGAMSDELLDELERMRIMWFSQASVEAGFDEPLLKRLKASGCRVLLLGLESLDEDNLRLMHKGVNVRNHDYAAAIANFRRNGICAYPNFICGYDHDTERSFDDIYDFAIKNRTFMCACNHLTPFAGTGLCDKLERDGRLRFERWWLDPNASYASVNFNPVGALTAEKLEHCCNDLRRRLYSPRSIARRALDFRANCGSLQRASIYWAANHSLSEDVAHREVLRFGDQSFEGELLPS